MEATGGAIYNIGSYRYHVFTLDLGSLIVTEAGNCDVRVIAPGGNGRAAGGGAGGYRAFNNTFLSIGTYRASCGFYFEFNGWRANHGGVGNDGSPPWGGGDGGSGGGSSSGYIGLGNIGGFTPPEGNDGGTGYGGTTGFGGGGGIVGKGHDGTSTSAGDGGDGIIDELLLAVFGVGDCCGGGAGKGFHGSTSGAAGLGGGNTHYGGGGDYYSTGGPGIIIIRYLTTPENPITPEDTYGEGNHLGSFYNEGDEFRYAPGHEDPEGTALWDMTNSFGHPPITPTHFPGCGYWWKVDGVASGPTRSSVPYSNTSKKWLANKGNGSWEL